MPKAKKIISWMLFAFVFIIYTLSTSKTISFWDSPEFVTSNYTLQATHPPGAPFYTILCKVILSFFPASYAAFISNLISAFFGALTVTFTFKIVTLITEKINPILTGFNKDYTAVFCGLISALTLAFSDSFWTASTEAEVYTLSFALMTGILYLMLLWEQTSNKIKEVRFLLMVSLLLGISVGVHLINIAIVIPISILITHKKFGLTFKSFIISLLVGCIVFLGIYGFIVQGFIKIAANLDIWLVNSFKFSVNTGTVAFILLISLFFGIVLKYTHKHHKTFLHYFILGLLFFLIGMSSYFMPMQRSNINNLIPNAITTNNRMLDYVKASQFGVGKIPLLYGPTYNAPLDKDVPFVDGTPVLTYDHEKKKYITSNDGKYKHVNYANEFKMPFPRLYDRGDAKMYQAWTLIEGENIQYPVKEIMTTIKKPTFSENLNFFFDYQVQWLNMRYLFWNFVGKQNDHHGLGYIKDGNWASGINAIDKSRIGDKDMIPEHYQNNAANDVYYFLPFILGLLGIVALRKHKQYLLTTILLFLTFGIGITIYVNPVPGSILVRERDYIFMGSFVIFSMWIGLAVLLITQLLQYAIAKKTSLIIAAIIAFLMAPLQLFAKGWDNHQRSHDNFSYNFGKAYLDACPPQAVLITEGDNMTFPLWYLQEVEGYRTDVRVINFDQLNIDTHIDNLKQTIYTSKPLKINLNKDLYVNGVEKLFPLQEEIKEPAVLPTFFSFLNSPKTTINWNGRMRHYVPATSFTLPIDTLLFKNKMLDPATLNASYVSDITWKYPKKFYGLNEIVLMNLITNNLTERPICFAINGKTGHYIGLQEYMVQHGLVDILTPIKRKDATVNPKIVATKMMYPYLMNQVQFENLSDENKYIRDENRTYVQDILRRNYYFLAQALLEEGKQKEALEILDKSSTLFPNATIPYKQYAFAIGKLYYRAGATDKGTQICLLAMKNIWEEIQWMTSFDPPHAVINLRHAYRLKNMYDQMRLQFPGNPAKIPVTEKMLKDFEAAFANWQQRNWPY